MNTQKEPKLSVVGAGPGDPDLITLKAVKALQAADVVLYDALVNKEILKHANPLAELHFVGKRKGYKRYSQDEINQMIVDLAYQKGHVVRLKGGDPYVFGRGAEEVEFANLRGIPGESVPGISSANAAPASIGIPLTSRGYSESYWVMTGTTSDLQLTRDIEQAARSTATMVFLMGMSNLPKIVSILKKNGKGNTPAAIIQNGTCENERSVVGTVTELPALKDKYRLSNPAIIIVGKVVRFSNPVPGYTDHPPVQVALNEIN